jgi:hypothetical protein
MFTACLRATIYSMFAFPHFCTAICLPVCILAPQQRLQLAAYDEAGSGMLDVQQLQRYLAAAVASAPLLACMEVSSPPESIIRQQ